MNLLNLTLSLIIALGTTFAHASTPDEDPFIKDLRARFESGTAPASSELTGKSFRCRTKWAWRGGMAEGFDEVSFTRSSSNGSLLALVSDESENSEVKRSFVHNGREWIATFQEKAGGTTLRSYQAYRKVSSDVLVEEHGLITEVKGAELLPLSAAPRGSKVQSYGICIPQE
jgi:hypothetical protein